MADEIKPIDEHELHRVLYEDCAQASDVFDHFAAAIHRLQSQKGFHDERHSVAHLMGMVMTELAEAVEDDRKDLAAGPSEKIAPFTRMEEEIADAIIRLLDFAGLHKLRIGPAIVAKIIFNAGRPHKHNRKY